MLGRVGDQIAIGGVVGGVAAPALHEVRGEGRGGGGEVEKWAIAGTMRCSGSAEGAGEATAAARDFSWAVGGAWSGGGEWDCVVSNFVFVVSEGSGTFRFVVLAEEGGGGENLILLD